MFSTEMLKIPETVKGKVDVATQAFRSYHSELQSVMQEIVQRQQEQLAVGKQKAEAIISAVELHNLLTRGNALYVRVGAAMAEWQGMIQEHLDRVMALMRIKGQKSVAAASSTNKAKTTTTKAKSSVKKAKKPTKKAKKPAKKTKKPAKKAKTPAKKAKR